MWGRFVAMASAHLLIIYASILMSVIAAGRIFWAVSLIFLQAKKVALRTSGSMARLAIPYRSGGQNYSPIANSNCPGPPESPAYFTGFAWPTWVAAAVNIRAFLYCALVVALSLAGFCQDANPPFDPRGFPTSRREPPSLKTLAKDQQNLWQARVTGNVNVAQAILHDYAMVTSYTGAINGKQLINQIATGVCKVNSFSLTHFVLESSHPGLKEFTYSALQDATCNDKHLPRTLQITVGYVDDGGDWTVAYYHEEISNGSTGPNQVSQ